MTEIYAGIDLGGTAIKAGLLSTEGERILSIKVPTVTLSGPDGVKKNLLETGEKLVSYSKQKGLRLHGIGIGSPGTIKYPDGIVTDSSPNIPGWIGVNFRRIFSGLDVEIRADNDANCMALGEYMFGAGKGTDSGFYITIGTGIGGALIQNKRLVRGFSHAAGEFGHTVFKYNGIRCKCGRRGCVEAYAAVPALIRSAREFAKEFPRSALRKKLDNLTPEIVFDAFKNGDRAASEAVRLNAHMLGCALGSVVNLINPEVLVIGGGLADAGREYVNMIKKNIFDYAFSSATVNLRVNPAGLGNSAGWIGAAGLFLE